MKKFLISLFIAMTFAMTFATDGINDKVKSSGFVSDTTNVVQQVNVFKFGSLDSILDCEILEYKNDVKSTPYKVEIRLSKMNDWYSLHNQYKTISEKYVKDYGTPNVVNEEFYINKDTINDAISKMNGVRDNKCNYMMLWVFNDSEGKPESQVQVKICNEGRTMITYKDSKACILNDSIKNNMKKK